MQVVQEAIRRFRDAWNALVSGASEGAAAEGPTEQARSRNLNRARQADVRPLNLEDDIPRYPSYMDGLPAVPVKTVLQTQMELLAKIRGEFEVNTDEERMIFERSLRRFAAIVHLLPASENDHHARAGGLFRHGLEVAHHALKISHVHAPFARSEYAERRKELNIRFRYAVLVAALCHDIGKPITDINVTDDSGSRRWNPFGASIPQWAQDLGVERYFIHWNRGRSKRHEPASLTLLSEILGTGGKAFLSDYPSSLFSDTLEAVGGDASPLNVIAKVVKTADSSSTAADKRQTVSDYGGTGIPVERYYLSAMRRLLSERGWKPNKPGSALWVLDGIAFLVWPAAGQDVRKLLQKDQVRGIPLDKDTIAREMLDRNLATPFVDDENNTQTLWPIRPEPLAHGKGAKLTLWALRLASVDMLTDEPIASVGGVYGGDALAVAGESDTRGTREDHAEEVIPDAGNAAEPEIPQSGAAEMQVSPPAKPAPTPEQAKRKKKVPGTDTRSESLSLDDPDAVQPSDLPEHEPPRKIPQDRIVEMDDEARREFFENNALMGHILQAFAEDLNRATVASPDIATVAYEVEGNEGRKVKIVALRAPDFFADCMPDMEIVREEAKSSGLFLLNANAELPFSVDEDAAEWWRLDYAASHAVLRHASKYVEKIRRKREKGEPGGQAAKRPSRAQDLGGRKARMQERKDKDQGVKAETPTMPEDAPMDTDAPPVVDADEAAPMVPEPEGGSGPASQSHSAQPDEKTDQGGQRPDEPGLEKPAKPEKSGEPRKPVAVAAGKITPLASRSGSKSTGTRAKPRPERLVFSGGKKSAPDTDLKPAEKGQAKTRAENHDEKIEFGEQITEVDGVKARIKWAKRSGQSESEPESVPLGGSGKGASGPEKEASEDQAVAQSPEKEDPLEGQSVSGSGGTPDADSEAPAPKKKSRSRKRRKSKKVPAPPPSERPLRDDGGPVIRAKRKDEVRKADNDTAPSPEQGPGTETAHQQEAAETPKSSEPQPMDARERKKKIQAEVMRVLKDRWESGLPEISNQELREVVGAAVNIEIRDHHLRVALAKVKAERIEMEVNGEKKEGYRINEAVADRLRTLTREGE
ncbi:Relaxase (plasmid) [Thioalkalivibrio sp. K90mix]|uniref:MobH family relaxase n=1 Tax=Thioalkalivibrio sp. (strain K90mix) TaxID=396595 RepID=UPI000195A7AA|nr:MobH family relaxase [Thioalkalivibrio sp. K90mix]ADC73299.1 Relaxase [Thioalkalivibrio sp. K90mix]